MTLNVGIIKTYWLFSNISDVVNI